MFHTYICVCLKCVQDQAESSVCKDFWATAGNQLRLQKSQSSYSCSILAAAFPKAKKTLYCELLGCSFLIKEANFLSYFQKDSNCELALDWKERRESWWEVKRIVRDDWRLCLVWKAARMRLGRLPERRELPSKGLATYLFRGWNLSYLNWNSESFETELLFNMVFKDSSIVSADSCSLSPIGSFIQIFVPVTA